MSSKKGRSCGETRTLPRIDWSKNYIRAVHALTVCLSDNGATLLVRCIMYSVKINWNEYQWSLELMLHDWDRHSLGPQGAVPEGSYLLQQSSVYRLWSEVPLFRGIRRPQDILETARLMWAPAMPLVPTIKIPSAVLWRTWGVRQITCLSVVPITKRFRLLTLEDELYFSM